MSKGCVKVFITQESISKVYVKVVWGYITVRYVQGSIYKRVCLREYVVGMSRLVEGSSKEVCQNVYVQEYV